MMITLQLSSEQERLLEEGAARQDGAAVREVLLQAVDPAVKSILKSQDQPPPEIRQSLLDELASEFADLPSVPDEAMSRASIYDNHL